MPSDIKECSLYSFTVHGVKTKTTPKDITARAAAEAAQTTANGKQDALTAAQLAAVNSGITAEKVAGYDAFSVPSAFSGSPEMDGTASPGTATAWARGDHVHPHDTSKQDALTIAQQAAVNSGVTAAKVAAWDAIEVPTKTSDLTNDSGFITANDIPAIPSKTSDLQNDSGFITGYTETDPTVPAWAKAPNKPTYTAAEVGALPDTTVIPTVPTNVSAFTNDAGYLTWYTETDPTVPSWAKQATKPTYTAAEVGALPDTTVIPTKTSDLTNDSGFVTSYTETDPTVPAWAKAASKPTYTASEVGALPDTTAIPAASSASPQMDGTAAAGTSANYARADHVHPSDSNKQDVLSSAQMDAVNSGITADDLAVNDASVLCSVTPISPTLSAGSHYATFGNCWYYKIGHKVTVHIGINGLTSNSNTTLWRLPAGYRPKSMVSFAGTGSSISNTSRYRIEENGDVKVRSEAAYAVGQIEFDAFN